MSDKKTFTNKFKRQAVDLLKNSGKKSIEIENDLGINRDNLLRWKREFETEEKDKNTVTIKHTDSKEVLQLKREMLILKQERDNLKKAHVIFSKPQK